MMKSNRCIAALAVLLLCPTIVFAQLAKVPSAGSAVNNDPAISGGNPQEFTVSVASLAAPPKARKAFDKGEQEARKGRWQAACNYFKTAVAMYPRYALAWLELGRMQIRQNSLVEANESLHQAVTQDSKLIDGYVELARVALQQENWKELAEVSDKLVKVAPESSADYWFLNSVAYFKLGNVPQAEASVTYGLRLDARHEIPQMEYLYGLILGSKHNYQAAADHIDAYLRLAPNSEDAEAARNARNAFQQRAKLAAADSDDDQN